MPVMMLQILKSMDSSKSQKSNYLESEILFFLQIIKLISDTWVTIIWPTINFIAEIKLNNLRKVI